MKVRVRVGLRLGLGLGFGIRMGLRLRIIFSPLDQVKDARLILGQASPGAFLSDILGVRYIRIKVEVKSG